MTLFDSISLTTGFNDQYLSEFGPGASHLQKQQEQCQNSHLHQLSTFISSENRRKKICFLDFPILRANCNSDQNSTIAKVISYRDSSILSEFTEETRLLQNSFRILSGASFLCFLVIIFKTNRQQWNSESCRSEFHSLLKATKNIFVS